MGIVVPVWWKQGKTVDDDRALSLAVNIGHEVLSGLDGVVDLEEEDKGKPVDLEKKGKGLQPLPEKQKRNCVPKCMCLWRQSAGLCNGANTCSTNISGASPVAAPWPHCCQDVHHDHARGGARCSAVRNARPSLRAHSRHTQRQRLKHISLYTVGAPVSEVHGLKLQSRRHPLAAKAQQQ
eukprot:4861894-Amphidinium_carterae.1